MDNKINELVDRLKSVFNHNEIEHLARDAHEIKAQNYSKQGE